MFCCPLVNGNRCSSVGIATTIRAGRSGDRIPVGGARFSAPIQTGSGSNPVSCTMGTGYFPAVKAAGAWCWLQPPSSAEIKKELSYNSTHPMCIPGPVTGLPLPLPLPLPLVNRLANRQEFCVCVQQNFNTTLKLFFPYFMTDLVSNITIRIKDLITEVTFLSHKFGNM